MFRIYSHFHLAYLILQRTSPLGKTLMQRLGVRMLWKAPIFSFLLHLNNIDDAVGAQLIFFLRIRPWARTHNPIKSICRVRPYLINKVSLSLRPYDVLFNIYFYFCLTQIFPKGILVNCHFWHADESILLIFLCINLPYCTLKFEFW